MTPMEPMLIGLGSAAAIGLLLAVLVWLLARASRRQGAADAANATLRKELDHAANARKNAEDAARLSDDAIRERLRPYFRD
jgi:hypothetical protein